MTIKVFRDFDFCKLAVQSKLNYGEKVKSRKAFIEAVEDYLTQYGEQCMDDHETEYSEFEELADEITSKYYKD